MSTSLAKMLFGERCVMQDAVDRKKMCVKRGKIKMNRIGNRIGE